MLKLAFILLLIFPAVLNAGDRYIVRFANDLSEVTVEACFDGAPPRNLYRHSESAPFTKWIRSNGKPVKNRSHYGRLRLPDLPDDSCVQWRVNLSAAVAQNNSRLALRLNDTILTSGSLWFWRDNERRDIHVEVELPPGFSISTPWQERQEGGKVTFWPDRTPASWAHCRGPFPGAPGSRYRDQITTVCNWRVAAQSTRSNYGVGARDRRMRGIHYRALSTTPAADPDYRDWQTK